MRVDGTKLGFAHSRPVNGRPELAKLNQILDDAIYFKLRLRKRFANCPVKYTSVTA